MKQLMILTGAVVVSTAIFAGAQIPFGPPPAQATLKITSQFDKNGDGWLNAAERAQAREYIGNLPRNERGFPPGFAGRGGPFGPPRTNTDEQSAQKGRTITPADVKKYPSASFYDEGTLRTLFITFEDKDWEKELEAFHGTDVDVPATLLVDGKTLRDVGVHFRGMSSYMGVATGRKRSFNVSVNMAHAEQNVGGYRTLNLLNSHEDPTFMRAVLFLHIARQYIPAPKANFVRIVINGENWGIYASVEQFNKDFVRENYRDAGGARWKVPGPNPQSGLRYLGDEAGAYKPLYEIRTKDDPAQWAALINLCKTLDRTPADELENALSRILDIDGALRFLALDNALVNNDGYWVRASDYSLYRGADGKFHIIPHDTNETFAARPSGPPPFGARGARGGFPFPPPGIESGRGPFGPLRPGAGPAAGLMMGDPTLDPLVGPDDPYKPLRSKLLNVPALREKYLGYVRDIAEGWLDWKTLGSLIGQYRALIDADVESDTKKLYSHEAFVSGLTGPTYSLRSFAADRSTTLVGLSIEK